MSEGYSIFGDINIKKALCITMLRQTWKSLW